MSFVFRYRERVVEACPVLQTLDGKEITLTTRRFVTSLATRRKDAKKDADRRQMTRVDTPTGSRGPGGGGGGGGGEVLESEKSGWRRGNVFVCSACDNTGL